MKIVHIQQYFNENLGYQENLLPYYQKKMGHEVVVITSTRSDGFNNDSRIKKDGEFSENGFRVLRINIKGEFKKRFVFFEDLYKYLEQEKPDYLFHHSVTSPSLLIASKYKKNNPHCFLAVDNHADLNISGRSLAWKLLYYNFLWKNIIRKCDEQIDIYFGVTPSRCLFLKEELGVSEEKIKLLPIGADVDHAKINLSKDELFNKLELDKDSMIIVHGGKITPEKEIYKILKAFKRIDNSRIRLILFGKIDDQKVAKILNEDSRIKYVGWLNRDETLALLRYSDIGIWNTQHTTLLEDCIAVGLPMIIRYYGSTSHLINKSGLYLYNGSIREIQDKLQLLIDNNELLNSFRKNANDHLQMLSYDNIAYESVEYMKSLKSLKTHAKLMSISFSDFTYSEFRRFIRK
ncbi:TPA: glycosyltransferase [Streptococcus suis]